MASRVRFAVGLLILLVLASRAEGQIISGESVVHDPVHSRYLASDQVTGAIMAVDYQGNLSTFTSTSGAAKGLMIRHDTLFCAASVTGLMLIDLDDGHAFLNVTFPGMSDLNDVIGDSSGNIYVSDAQGNQVFRLHLSDLSTKRVLGDFPWANGMVFDTARNRILICQWITRSPITAINLSDSTTEVVRDDSLYRLDGLAWDVDGNLFVSSHGTGDIYVYDSSFSSPPRMVLDLPAGSADIAFNYLDTILAIPNTNTGLLRFEPMRDPDRDLFFEAADNCPWITNPDQLNRDGDALGDACDNCPAITNPAQAALPDNGDVNGDAAITAADIIWLVNYVFKGGASPVPCAAIGDVQCSGSVTSTDIIFLVNYTFKGGPLPCVVCEAYGLDWTCP